MTAKTTLKIAKFFAGMILWMVFILVYCEFFKHPDMGGFLVVLWVTYMMSPIKKPADYNSYEEWWKDWRHWLTPEEKNPLIPRVKK